MTKRTIFLIIFILQASYLWASDLSVIITGVKKDDGRIYVGLFNDPKEFPWGKQQKGQFTVGDKETVRVVFTDVDFGNYAIVAYQDKNANEELDLNFLGIPKELYGITGIKVLREPTFEEASFEVSSDNQQIRIEVE